MASSVAAKLKATVNSGFDTKLSSSSSLSTYLKVSAASVADVDATAESFFNWCCSSNHLGHNSSQAEGCKTSTALPFWTICTERLLHSASHAPSAVSYCEDIHALQLKTR